MIASPMVSRSEEAFVADAISAIAGCLETAAHTSLEIDEFGHAVMFASVASGLPGIALALMHLGEITGRDHSAAIAAALAESMRIVSQYPLSISLFNGVGGVAWVMEQYRRRYGEGDVSSSLDDFDDILRTHLDTYRPWILDFDLMNGLVGHGVYALERLP